MRENRIGLAMNGNDPTRLGIRSRLWFLAKDTALYGIASAVSKLSALILFPILTREFSVEEYGRIDYILYGTMFFGLLTVFGQDSAVARLFFEVDEHSKRQQLISQALVIIAINGLVSIAVIGALASSSIATTAMGGHDDTLILLFIFYAPLTGLLSFCQGVLKWTFERKKYIMVALGVPFSNLLLIYVSSRYLDLTIVDLIFLMLGVTTTFALLGVFYIRNWLAMPGSGHYMRKLLPLSLPYGVIAVISAVVPLYERSAVTAQFGTYDLGLYAVGAKIASMTLLVSTAFHMGWGPFSYSIYKEENAAHTYNLVLRLFTAMICLVVLAISAIGGPLIRFLAGEDYLGGAIFVFPLAMAVGMQAIGWITEIGIHLSKKTYLNLFGFSLLLVSSVVSIIFLSRTIGIIGVALGALAGQVLMAVTSAFVAQRVYRMSWNYGLPVATVALTIIVGAAAFLAKRNGIEVSGTAIYAGGMVIIVALNALFGLTRANRQALRRAISARFTDLSG